MSKDRTYAISVGLTVFVLVIMNFLHYHRPVTCADCLWSYGLPFTFYHEGGLAGGEGWVLRGLLGDIAVAVASGTVIGFAWNLVRRR